MTKTQKAEQEAKKEAAIRQLREMLKPGDTVKTILRHVSRSGMSRSISVVVNGEDVTYLAARAMGEKYPDRYDGITVGGCGMDMGFHLVYNLSRTLFPVYDCTGSRYDTPEGAKGCPSNDHVNSGPKRDDYRVGTAHSDGYALHQRWM